MDIATSAARRSLRESIAALALFIGGLAWIAAFWFPSFYTSQGPVEGYWVFATGWMGFTIFQFAWYANLLMLLGITLMYSSPLWGSILSSLAVLVATQAFWFNSIPTGEVDIPIIQLGQGFWCWYGSITLLGLGVFLGSEQTEAEKNQTTKNQHVSELDLKLKKFPPQPATLAVMTMPVALVPELHGTKHLATAEAYEPVILQSEPLANSSVVSVVEQELVSVSMNAATAELDTTSPPFAVVPEPDVPEFTAANEQEYLQLPDKVALKPVYTEHLAEDWPPKMSLVVKPDPFTTERHLDNELPEVTEQAKDTVKPKIEGLSTSATGAPVQTTTGFFDPWRT
ncbi:hypothetical protein [uncultured Thiothrix sp.]|jgi:hypothetical protein|uniref:hypothetical protein n=1 Tax=uncultured Thiothrix sp. TaxID=223185 RepID=UPI002638DA1E|nr:hypothetical protein [uncultured Thiothrix sp.]HMT92259.1 hypothetical protein [Thiolinea sp.]